MHESAGVMRALRLATSPVSAVALCLLGALSGHGLAHAQDSPTAPPPVQYAPPPASAQVPPAAPPPAAPLVQAPALISLTPLSPPPARGRRALVPPAALGVKGEVLKTDDLQATISVGARDGLTPGTPVLFVTQAQNLTDSWSDEKDVQVVGEVVNVAEDRALVALGLLESVSVGQAIEVTIDRPSARRVAPPRPPAMLIVEGGLRPFLPIRRVSVGAFADLALTYLPAIPMFVRAELSPLGGRLGAGSDMGALGGLLSVGYDHRYASVGLGAGAITHRDYVDNADGYSRRLGEAVPRFQLAQLLRAGARDGLHISAKTAFALATDRWRLASLTIAGQLPVATRAAVTPRFVIAPQAGVFSAELGVRLLMRGNGGHDSLFVRPLAGLSGTFDAERNGVGSYSSEQLADTIGNMLFGPMIGVDLEWRL